jgi:hypothetical protein
MTKIYGTSKDFQSYDFNREIIQKPMSNFAKDFYSCHSDKEIRQCILSSERTKDFRSCDSNSKPTSSFSKDFYSLSGKDIQQYFSSLGETTKNSQSHDSNIQRPSFERTTKNFRSRDSYLRPMSSFAKDFYSCNPDKEIQQYSENLQSHNSNSSIQQPNSSYKRATKKSFYSHNPNKSSQQPISGSKVHNDFDIDIAQYILSLENFQLNDTNSNIQQSISSSERATKNNYSYNSNVNSQKSISNSGRTNSLPDDSDVEHLIESINNS